MNEANGENGDTTRKQRGGITGKGFVAGDPRINRHGRPRSFDQLRKLAQELAHSEVPKGKFKGMTLATAILAGWACSREPTLQKAFVEYAFGKVADKHEVEGEIEQTVIILRHAHEDFEPSRS